MKKIFYFTLLLPFLFSSCGKDDKKALWGTWELKSASLTISPPNAELEKIMSKEMNEDVGKLEIRFHEDNTYSLSVPSEMKGLSLTGAYSYEKETLILKNEIFNDGELKLSASIINKGKSLKIKIANAKDLGIYDDDADDESELEKGIEKITVEFIFDKK